MTVTVEYQVGGFNILGQGLLPWAWLQGSGLGFSEVVQESYIKNTQPKLEIPTVENLTTLETPNSKQQSSRKS